MISKIFDQLRELIKAALSWLAREQFEEAHKIEAECYGCWKDRIRVIVQE
jgi:hypothetical protein